MYNMPSGRTRTSNSQGRQKSCSPCAKAKRRCDLRQPNCIRCTRQKLNCVYPPHPNSSSIATPASLDDTPATDKDNGFSEAPSWLGVEAPSFATMLGEEDLLGFDINPLDPCLEGIEGGTVTKTPSPLDTSYTDKYLAMFIMTPLAESRIRYSLEQWKMTPEMMVKENRTHWSHPKLYEDCMPRSVQDAYAACALAMARTETNATFIARHITERAYELVDQPQPVTPVDILARAHALILYQIILICSNDIRYYQQAGKLIPHLEQIGATLTAITSCDEEGNDSIAVYPSNVAREAWTTYIFQESCRRTLLTIFQAIATCRVLMGQYSICVHQLSAGNRFTVSSALWHAKSPFDFAMAWNDKNHFVVRELDFQEVLQNAVADDVDCFGLMMLTAMMGIDDVKGWLHTRGGKL
ncbi:hypothetical protein P280DRAFT_495888 [Massarina eburnea CBS 473.64]|uniref:Zn(2)-C6 fungal-type domain-containing protein n=1 Tax=Massarina eburnea CBS 473.64 TaxID=1395130 RepID=A0A6A6SAA0_9PLEO|nr:hypothetical protein P280DRAFT_495888 [Massarina eburnea CBS 473.64]